MTTGLIAPLDDLAEVEVDHFVIEPVVAFQSHHVSAPDSQPFVQQLELAEDLVALLVRTPCPKQ